MYGTLKKIGIILLMFSFLNAKESINKFENKINNAICNLLNNRNDSTLLDTNIYIGALKEKEIETKNFLFSKLNKNLKITKNVDNKIERETIKFEGIFKSKLSLTSLNILKTSKVIYIEENDTNNLFLGFLDDKFENEKLFTTFTLSKKYFNFDKLKHSFNIVNNIFLNPDTIEIINKKIYNDLKRPDYEKKTTFNQLIEFIALDYEFWLLDVIENVNYIEIIFYFKLNHTKLSINLKYNIESDNFTLNSLLIGELKI